MQITCQKCLELEGLTKCEPFMVTVLPEVGLVTNLALRGL
jgi:hypothetical protein